MENIRGMGVDSVPQ